MSETPTELTDQRREELRGFLENLPENISELCQKAHVLYLKDARAEHKEYVQNLLALLDAKPTPQEPKKETVEILINEMEQMFMQRNTRKDREWFIRHVIKSAPQEPTEQKKQDREAVERMGRAIESDFEREDLDWAPSQALSHYHKNKEALAHIKRRLGVEEE